jgi:hypothetical protein
MATLHAPQAEEGTSSFEAELARDFAAEFLDNGRLLGANVVVLSKGKVGTRTGCYHDALTSSPHAGHF